jgi:pimeloyl-ACP methyl ester carboxylesterase
MVFFAGNALAAACPDPPRTRDRTFPTPAQTSSPSPRIYLNYSVVGTGAEVLVALHGFGASLDTWHDIAPLLETRYQLYLLDMVGFGLSARPAGFHYTLREQADVVASFLEFVQRESGGRPITLVGHSFGGSVAIAAFRILKERHVKDPTMPLVHNLILIDALGFPKQVHLPLYIKILRVPVANRLALSLPATFIVRYVLTHVFAPMDRPLVTPERVCRYAETLPRSHRAMIDTVKDVGNKGDIAWLTEAIKEIDVPTLIIWGKYDPLIPANPQASHFNSDIHGSLLSPFLAAGHVPHEELPSETAALIQNFLK